MKAIVICIWNLFEKVNLGMPNEFPSLLIPNTSSVSKSKSSNRKQRQMMFPLSCQKYRMKLEKD